MKHPLICRGCGEYAEIPGGCECPEAEPQSQESAALAWWEGAGACQGDFDWLAALGLIAGPDAEFDAALLADPRVMARAQMQPAEHMQVLHDEYLLEQAALREAGELCREAA